ncbi:MAG: hypothetical protein ACOH1I_01000 [Gallionellaceae bacterium]|jgi:hypothetical protein
MFDIIYTASSAAALLKINGVNLLLPQSEIRSLESVTDVDVIAPALHSTGWITYLHKRWPVYCLSEKLTLLTNMEKETRACALIAMGAGYIGIMCNDMIVLKNFTAQRYDLPVAMRLPDSPVLYLVQYEQEIASVSNAARLTAYIEQQVLKS